MAAYWNGRLEPERVHSPQEPEQAECLDCRESVHDPDEEFCAHCGDPLCVDCQQVINEEPLCAKCFAALRKADLESLPKDPNVGDLVPAAA